MADFYWWRVRVWYGTAFRNGWSVESSRKIANGIRGAASRTYEAVEVGPDRPVLRIQSPTAGSRMYTRFQFRGRLAGRRGTTLLEPVTARTVGVLSFPGIIMGFESSGRRAEWASRNTAARDFADSVATLSAPNQ